MYKLEQVIRRLQREMIMDCLYAMDLKKTDVSDLDATAFLSENTINTLAYIKERLEQDMVTSILEMKEWASTHVSPAFFENLSEERVDSEAFYARLSEWVIEYVKEAVEGISKRLEELDEVISANLERWTIRRLNYVDRSIMRLATYELLVLDLPKHVVINEAIELSKAYTETDDVKSPAFNNRVLDRIADYLHK